MKSKRFFAKKPTDKSDDPELEFTSFFTPKPKKKNTTAKPPPISFASAIRNGPQPSAKRMRSEKSSAIAEFNAPKPKTGTKTTFTGLSVVAKPKRIKKPTFTKALWISRLNPETSEGEIADYIAQNTSITDFSKFKAHKLVKKDCDLTALKFVSFKIEMNDEEYDILSNPDVWPENVMVREFLQSNTLGAHIFPAFNAKNQMESMDTTEAQPIQEQQENPIQIPLATSTQTQPQNKKE